jgi:hemoglobin-like flavoprotein
MNNPNAATTASCTGDDADAPNTANRWKIELRNHGSKFFNSLDDLISVVDKPDELFKMLHEIGSRHKTYEVKAEHIQVCSSCLCLVGPLIVVRLVLSI